MNAQDYSKILNAVPEIAEILTSKISDVKKKEIAEVADGVIGVSGAILGGAALVASMISGKK